MADIILNTASDIVYVAGRVNGSVTVFNKLPGGRWCGYAATATDNLYHICVEAYDAAGNKSDYESTVYYEPPWFVTDRTAVDVEKRTAKGVLNAVDLNRIEKNIGIISEWAALPVKVKTDWKVGGLPRASDWERISDYVQRIREYAHRSDTPMMPERPFNHWKKVNDIEQILKDAYDMLSANSKSIHYCGEIYAGEGGML